jgi:hypothetical protein
LPKYGKKESRHRFAENLSEIRESNHSPKLKELEKEEIETKLYKHIGSPQGIYASMATNATSIDSTAF